MGFDTDQTAVIVPVPDVEPLVGRWRSRFDSSAGFGVPAHLTLVYPFIPFPRLTDTDLADLRALFTGQPPVEVEFTGFGAFPGVLYLAPEPAEPFRQLTRAIVDRWPDAPPYGGQFGDEITPHLTVSDVAGIEDGNRILDQVSRQLPLATTVGRAVLIRFDGEKWVTAQELPFAS